VQDKGILSMED